MRFPHHVVVRARCTKRWRGANFDQAAADGAVGAAIARALGLGIKSQAELERFYEKAFVRSYAQPLDPNPETPFDPNEGQAFEFHVGLREPAAAEKVVAIERAAREAVAGSKHFVIL